MEAAIHIKTKVLPGSKIEITSPDLVEGQPVEVFVVLPGPGRRGKHTVMDMIERGEFPKRKSTADDVDRYLQEERDSWDR